MDVGKSLKRKLSETSLLKYQVLYSVYTITTTELQL